ncbi:hypothetical protein NBRC116586_13830 [Pseudooceanicola nitratireducens]
MARMVAAKALPSRIWALIQTLLQGCGFGAILRILADPRDGGWGVVAGPDGPDTRVTRPSWPVSDGLSEQARDRARVV